MAQRKLRHFGPHDLSAIEEAVAEAEKKTSGEIVTVIAPSSSPYRELTWAWVILGWLLTSIAIEIASASAHWPLPVYHVIEWQLLGTVIGFALSKVPFVRRISLSKRQSSRQVHSQALAHFTALGVANTRSRTGILIYISELEHVVEILSDRGLSELCSEGYWQEQVGAITEGLRSGAGAKALCTSIRNIGEKLSLQFPPETNDTNELTNTVWLGNQVQKDPTNEPKT